MSVNIEAILRVVEQQQRNPDSLRSVARIRAVVAHETGTGSFPLEVDAGENRGFSYHHPNFSFYPDELMFTVGGNRVHLTLTETKILKALSTTPNRTVARKNLATLLGLRDDIDADKKTVNIHVSHLRTKFTKTARIDDPIQTVYGMGYMLIDTSRPPIEEL